MILFVSKWKEKEREKLNLFRESIRNMKPSYLNGLSKYYLLLIPMYFYLFHFAFVL